MGLITKIRSLLYGSAKILGDVSAVSQGKVANRVRNRIFGSIAGKILQMFLR